MLMLAYADMPESLQSLPQPPRQLFYRGAPLGNWLSSPKLAVVGSRKVTPYGRQITEQLTTAAVRAGVVVISGLAIGVDSIAHRASLEAGGTTAAVLPGSVTDVYPSNHRALADKIVEQGGTLISEQGPGAPVYKQSFIARNRLISGLADAVLITEAALKSGSLHTARFALEQGKTVMAVPGNITSPMSEGANNLIRSGATPVTSPIDIFFALGLKPTKNKSLDLPNLTDHERQIVALLQAGNSDQASLADQCKLPAAVFNSTLTMLELNGHIRPLGGGQWALAN